MLYLCKQFYCAPRGRKEPAVRGAITVQSNILQGKFKEKTIETNDFSRRFESRIRRETAVS